ncbi:hypothetical protein, partial [Kitasatospora aureofaciens]|uniref:hypothetical protein n=1 Tax=Kitasatospora aureofaciens TaxID=1894 RepID=UPI0037FC041E
SFVAFVTAWPELLVPPRPADSHDHRDFETPLGGLVTMRNPDGSLRRLRDPGRALERWLLDEGVGNLDPEVVATVRQELTR